MKAGIRIAEKSELKSFIEMELDDENAPFVNSDTLEKHTEWFENDSFLHISIDAGGRLSGYALLVLDADGRSVELRRIVVMLKGRRVGQESMKLISDFCREKLGRVSIWLDVMPTNTRAKHVYRKLGFEFVKESESDGEQLHFYSKML